MTTKTDTPLIYSLMAQIMGELEPIGKDHNNVQQKYKFRSIEDIYIELKKLCSGYGVFTLPQVLKCSREERTSKTGTLLITTLLEVKTTFYAKDGSSVEAITVGEGMDSGDKASNKAMSAAHKYALVQAFFIAGEEKLDTEYESHEAATLAKPPASKPQSSGDRLTCPECGLVEKFIPSKYGGYWCIECKYKDVSFIPPSSDKPKAASKDPLVELGDFAKSFGWTLGDLREYLLEEFAFEGVRSDNLKTAMTAKMIEKAKQHIADAHAAAASIKG